MDNIPSNGSFDAETLELEAREGISPDSLAASAETLAQRGATSAAVAGYVTAGRRYLETDGRDAARRCFDRAHNLDPDNRVALFELGRLDTAEGRKGEALERFLEILSRSNFVHVPALFEAGCLYEESGNVEQAISFFGRIAQRDKGHIGSLVHLAAIHRSQNQVNEAANCYAQAAAAAHKTSQHDEARRFAREALALDPQNSSAKQILAELDAVRPSLPSAPSPPSISRQLPSPTPSHVATNAASTASLDEMFEKQLEAAAELAQVAAAVAQAHKKRQVIDERINTLQATLGALEAEKNAAEERLAAAKGQLLKVAEAKATEDAQLAATQERLQKARARLETATAVARGVDELESRSAETVRAIDALRSEAAKIKAASETAAAQAAAVESSSADLKIKIDEARRAAESAAQRLDGVAGKAREISAGADTLATHYAQISAALDSAETLRRQTEDALKNTESMAAVATATQTEVAAALSDIESIRGERRAELEAILPELGEASSTADQAGSAAPPQPHVTPPLEAAAAPPTTPAPSAAVPTGPAPVASATPPSETVAQLDPVEALIRDGRYTQALRTARDQAKSKQDPAQYLSRLGDQLREAGDYGTSAQAYEAARGLNRADTQIQLKLARTYADLGRTKDALKLLERIPIDSEFGARARIVSAQCLWHSGRNDEAAKGLSALLEYPGLKQDDCNEALYALADIHESAGDTKSLEIALWALEEIAASDSSYRDVGTRAEKIKARLAPSRPTVSARAE